MAKQSGGTPIASNDEVADQIGTRRCLEKNSYNPSAILIQMTTWTATTRGFRWAGARLHMITLRTTGSRKVSITEVNGRLSTPGTGTQKPASEEVHEQKFRSRNDTFQFANRIPATD